MKKLSLHTWLLWLAILVIFGSTALRITHQISSTASQFLFGLSLLLYFIARWMKDKSKDQNV
jgi:nicotinamide riboside transporter PnuC